MSGKSNFEYTRVIKLAPAIGDWTTIQYRDSDLEEINISPVLDINFDSLPKERLKYVHYLHYRLAENLVAMLSKDLDIKVELHTVAATQMSYKDFLGTQTDDVVQGEITLENIGRMNVIFDWGLVDMLVNRLLGGKGEESGNTEFSEVELKVMKTELEQIMPLFSEAWKNVFTQEQASLDLRLGKFKLDQKLSYREAIILFSIYLNFGNGDLRKVVLAYPNRVLRRLIYIRSGLQDPIKKRVSLDNKTLRTVKIGMKAVLGKATLTMNDLRNLNKGDVITLDTRLDSPVEVELDGKIKLYAQPGVLNKRLCMQLIFWDGSDPLERYLDMALPSEVPEEPTHVQSALVSAVEEAPQEREVAVNTSLAEELAPIEDEPDELEQDQNYEEEITTEEPEAVELEEPEVMATIESEPPVIEESAVVEPELAFEQGQEDTPRRSASFSQIEETRESSNFSEPLEPLESPPEQELELESDSELEATQDEVPRESEFEAPTANPEIDADPRVSEAETGVGQETDDDDDDDDIDDYEEDDDDDFSWDDLDDEF